MDSRPQYETPEDIAKQAEVEKAIAERWKIRIERMPKSYRIDTALATRDESQKIRGWLEIKVRNNASTAYPTYMLALGKWLAGIDLEQKTHLPFILAVGFTDGIRTCKPSECKFEVRWGGRTLNTRDSADIEPVVHIPMEFFKAL